MEVSGRGHSGGGGVHAEAWLAKSRRQLAGSYVRWGCAGWLGWKGALGPGGEVGNGLEGWQVAEDNPSSLEVVAGSLNTRKQKCGVGTAGIGQTSAGLNCWAADPL